MPAAASCSSGHSLYTLCARTASSSDIPTWKDSRIGVAFGLGGVGAEDQGVVAEEPLRLTLILLIAGHLPLAAVQPGARDAVVAGAKVRNPVLAGAELGGQRLAAGSWAGGEMLRAGGDLVRIHASNTHVHEEIGRVTSSP